MLRIDGSLGHGGGHTVRTALTLAAIARREVEIVNVRKGRRAPGMRHGLIATARAIATYTNGRLEGDAPGSDTLRFYPGRPSPGEFTFTVGDAQHGVDPVGPALQALLPLAIVGGGTTTFVLRGPTHCASAPTATYLQTVFLPTIRKFGVRAEITTDRWGWAPRGTGAVTARIESVRSLSARDLTQRGELLQIGGTSVVNGAEPGFAERIKNRAVRRLQELGRPAAIQVLTVPSDTTGGMLFLLAVFERSIAGFTSMVAEGLAAEQVADTAVEDLRAYLASYSVVDKHLADQLVLYGALASGVTAFSTSELTPHTAALAELIPRFIRARVSIAGALGSAADVEIVGAGGPR
jgi:RNA 3'-terminal phosphate cyclase (ATP)